MHKPMFNCSFIYGEQLKDFQETTFRFNKSMCLYSKYLCVYRAEKEVFWYKIQKMSVI